MRIEELNSIISFLGTIQYNSTEKQKEQKDYNKLYEDIGKSEWFKKAYEGKSLGCDYEQKEQKPIEPSDEELQRYQNELYDFKVFATKQAKEHHISFVHDFEWNNFCAELLSYFNEQKPEWSEEDEEKLERVEDLLWMLDDYLGDDCSICEEKTARLRDEIQKELCPWLKSLRPWKPNVEKLYYDRVNKEFYVKETINDPKSAIQELYKRLNKQ